MTLERATAPDGTALGLPGKPPYPADLFVPWVGVPVVFPEDDPFVSGAGDREHAYLDGATDAWDTHPEWMDYLDLSSPARDLKRAERDLYLHWWHRLGGAARVLDVGCGIGRFVCPLLDGGADVWGVDADQESLRRCLWHAAGRPGRLELSWSSVHKLPDVEVDAAIACEVLCYVPDVENALAGIVDRIRPGGRLFVSMEARWGWASAEDTPADSIEAALDGDGVLDLPGDRWVRTYEADEFRALLEDAKLDVETLVATHYLTDGPLERTMPDDWSLEDLLAWEEKARKHRIWGPLNRAWTAVAVKR